MARDSNLPSLRDSAARPTAPRRSWPVVALFGAIIALQLVVAAVSIDVLSSVRAYVTGESLYSKGQKDAQIYLLDYAEYHKEDDYRRFQQSLAVPLGDRFAREALQRPNPDLALAREGFLQGGNHPDDIAGLIRLFRWFHDIPFMADAITTWTDGDLVIQQMRELAERSREKVLRGEVDAASGSEMRAQALHLNSRLTQLESKFSAQLGEASRQTQRLLLVVNAALAALLAATGVAFVRRAARVQALTEDQVRDRQESLQGLLDSAAEGLFGVDPGGKCTFINRAALQMLGYDRESELLGREIYDLVQPSLAGGGSAAGAMRQANTEHQEVHIADAMFRRRDATSFPVEYWSHPVAQGGRVHGAVATFFDISARLTMQAAVRQGELRIVKLVDAVTDGVITIDSENRIVVFNRAAETLFGVAASDAIGGPIDRFIPFRPERRSDAATNRFVNGDHATKPPGALHELIGKRANGDEFPLEASLSRLETDRGVLMTVVMRDVTELHLSRAERQARSALEAANRAKTEFLSRMSHELRTPLNAVLGFAQLLRLDAVRPPTIEQLGRIQHIENAGAHLLALVNDVLDLSRVESGQMMVSIEAVDLGDAVADALAMVSPLAAAADVRLRVSNPATGTLDVEDMRNAGARHPVWVLADKVRMRQVLVNLLSNAVKYNRIGGSVTVSFEGSGATGSARIEDSGLGMTSEKLERLFEPFNRLGAERSNIEGTGIGLVLSRRLVELMEGDLMISSTLGYGTVATLVLKATEAPSTTLRAQAPPSQHGPLGGTLRVLYAEDDEVNVELIRQVVALRPTVDLSVATNGARALEMARRDPPDLMLVDMNLGDMTGLELASALLESPQTAGLRLVALSADALPEQISATLAAGFESYLTKPVDFRKFLDVLDSHLSAEV
ncbi:MAG: PAS domain S-box protein [Caldimonas sp.]